MAGLRKFATDQVTFDKNVLFSIGEILDVEKSSRLQGGQFRNTSLEGQYFYFCATWPNLERVVLDVSG